MEDSALLPEHAATCFGLFLICRYIHTNYRILFCCSLQAGLDQVKWIDGDDCLANGIIGDVEDAEGIFNFDLLYFDATGFTAQIIAFPEEEIGGPYAMCCECDGCMPNEQELNACPSYR